MKRRALMLGMLGLAGCLVVAEEPEPVAIEGEGYRPLFYRGYIVYYDYYGRPHYYVGGVVHHVPRTYVHYDVLVEHYHVHRPSYDRWYRARGRSHRHYRRPAPRPSRRTRPRRDRPAGPHRR